jgi:two-component sensor histidine kinase
VGKYAVGATRLTVTCTQEQDWQVIRVADNGIGLSEATETTKQLAGTFQRYPHQPKGTVCELKWRTRKNWLW